MAKQPVSQKTTALSIVAVVFIFILVTLAVISNPPEQLVVEDQTQSQAEERIRIDPQHSPYSKDSQHVYYFDEVVEGADPATFQLFDEAYLDYKRYAYDATHVFLENLYSHDATHVFLGTNMIPEADPMTFELLENAKYCYNHLYTQDKNHIYQGADLLKGFDQDSFRVLGSVDWGLYTYTCITADKNAVYADGQELTNFDLNPATTKLVGGYIVDDQGVYFGTKYQIEGADPASFQLAELKLEQVDGLASSAAVDQNSVYYCGQPIMPNQPGYRFPEYADIELATQGHFYGISGDSVYYKNQKIDGADANSFVVVSPLNYGVFQCDEDEDDGGYAKDKYHVYYNAQVVLGADPDTFDIKQSYYVTLLIDEHGEYQAGVLVPNNFVECSTDPESLPELGWYAQQPNFEYCVLPDERLLVGYSANDIYPGHTKKLILLDQKLNMINEAVLDCGPALVVRHPSIRSLDGSIVTLKCLADCHEPCDPEAFFELDLDEMEKDGNPEIRQVLESNQLEQIY